MSEVIIDENKAQEVMIIAEPDGTKREVKLTQEEQAKVDAIVKTIDIEDSQATLQYGVQAQSNIANFSDSILSEVRSKDTGHVGEALTSLMVDIKEIDVDGINDKGFLGIFRNFKNSTKKFIARYEKMSVQMDATILELDKSKMQLLSDITMLDKLYDKNLEYMKELEYYIIAGERKIQEIQEVALPQMMQQAKESGDALDAQKVTDYNQLLNRFEKKVHDLKLSRMISIQTGPQVRLIQSSDQVLVEKIQSSILNTIPLWKNQVVIAISLFRQEKALKQQQVVTETTNDLLKKNSEMLKENTIEVAKESEKGIVEIETLKKVNQDLLTTIDETMKIQKEGREKRRVAEQELQEMELNIKNKLQDVSR